LVRIDHAELRGLVRTVFGHAGSEPREAEILATHLVEANLMGHDSHGVIRIAPYLEWLKAGKVRANRHARVVTDLGAVIAVEGDRGYGLVIAGEAMALAIERARDGGAAVLALRECSHLGRVGAWAEMAAEAGLVSVHFVNTSGFGIHVAPHGGSDRRLSANPIAAGVPVPGRPPIILDMATSSIAAGKIRVAHNKAESLPEGCMLDKYGRPTRDPASFYSDPPGAILPFGGHKGSGLSLICEVLAGSLTGGLSSHPDNPSADRLVNNMLSIVLDPARLSSAADYGADVTRLVEWVTGSPPIEPGGEVLLPGEVERRTKAERSARGLPLDDKTLGQVRSAARSVGVPDRELAILGGPIDGS
jgi:uncharacterized oxidoreductase